MASGTINTFHKGLWMDLANLFTPEGTYRWAQNVQLVPDGSGTGGSLQAVEGVVKYDFLAASPDREGSVSGLPSLGIIRHITTIRNYIVIFVNVSGSSGYDTEIYRGEVVDTKIDLRRIARGLLSLGNDGSGVQNEISSVSRYIADDDIKVYWADGYHEIMLINIADGFTTRYPNIITIEDSSINPDSILPKPIFLGTSTGSLKGGIIQYAYQLYNKDGSQTGLSPMSDLIHLAKNTNNFRTIAGESSELSSGKGVSIKIPAVPGYNHVRLFSFRYTDNIATPEVVVVADKSYDGSEELIQDLGQKISDSSWEDFLTEESKAIIIPKSIEAKDGILFASNVKEKSFSFAKPGDDSWYDTRVFGFNLDGYCELYDTSGSYIQIYYTDLTQLTDAQWLAKVPADHDCIHWNSMNMTKARHRTYCYPGNAEGGSGRNISYKFITSVTAESYITKVSNDVLPDNLTRNSTGQKQLWNKLGYTKPDAVIDSSFTTSSALKTLPISYGRPPVIEHAFTGWTDSVQIVPSSSEVGLTSISYANEYIDARLKGYMRDELYRFAIVFYDSKGNKSVPSWIADIRMPSMQDEAWRLFDQNAFLKLDSTQKHRFEVVFYPLGLQFSLKNVDILIDNGVVAVEIVRAKREDTDRSIVMQGIFGRTNNTVDDKGRRLDKSRVDQSGTKNLPDPTTVAANWHLGMGNDYGICFGAIPSNSGSAAAPTFMGSTGLTSNRDFTGYHDNTDRVNYLKPFIFCSPEIDFQQETIRNKIGGNGLVINTLIGLTGITSADFSDVNESGYAYDSWGTGRFLKSNSITAAQTAYSTRYPGVVMCSTWTNIYVQNPKDYTFMENLAVDMRVRSNVESDYDPYTLVSKMFSPFNATITKSWNNDPTYNTDGGWYEAYGKDDPLYSGTLGDIFKHFELDSYDIHTNISPVVSAIKDDFNASIIYYDDDPVEVTIPYYKGTALSYSLLNAGGMKFIPWVPMYGINTLWEGFLFYKGYFTDESLDYATPVRAFYQGVVGPCMLISSSNADFSLGYYFGHSNRIGRVGSSNGVRYTKTQLGSQDYLTKLSLLPSTSDMLNIVDHTTWYGVRNAIFNGGNYIAYRTTYQEEERAYNRICKHMAMNTVILANIKQSVVPYGGLGYESRKLTDYVSIGNWIDIRNEESITENIFGGDIYLCLADHTYCMPIQNPEQICYMNETMYTRAYIFPCETSINMWLQHGESYLKRTNVDGTFPLELELEPYASIGGIGTSKPMYAYNSAYSASSKTGTFVEDIDDDSNSVYKYDVRVYHSSNTTNTKIDSWTLFRPFDYIDVDSRYGQITSIKLFNNNLYFWQDNAFGVLSVNRQSLLNEGDSIGLVLGKGGVLDRYDYLSTTNGLKVNMSSAIGTNQSYLFWYDRVRNELVSVTNGTEALSKIKGIQTYLNRHEDDITDNVITGYNHKYNDFYIRLRHTVVDPISNVAYLNLSINEQLNAPVSHISNNPVFYVNVGDSVLFAVDSNKSFYKINGGAPGKSISLTIDQSKVVVPVCKDIHVVKVFDNIIIPAEGLVDTDAATHTNISLNLKTKHQTAGVSNSLIVNGYREGSYKIAVPRESLNSIGRLRGEWMEITLQVTPPTNNFYISFIETYYRKSNI